MQIELDVPRTFPENGFFGNDGYGRSTLQVILKTLCKHSSSTGYTQGMNFIVASLFYHCGEVLAFEMTIRALNDYHLKAIYMSQLPGLIFHCKVLQALLLEEIPDLGKKFKNDIDLMVVCQTWIMCLFTQVIPLNQVQRFYTLFWQNGWVLIYRLVLSIFNEHKEGLLKDTNEIEI